MYMKLEVTQGVALGLPDVFPEIEPESHEEVEHHGRAHGQARSIDEILTYGGAGHAHFLTHPGANAKHMAFDKLPEPVHSTNLQYSLLATDPNFANFAIPEESYFLAAVA
jgi:hypothetical protein